MEHRLRLLLVRLVLYEEVATPASKLSSCPFTHLSSGSSTLLLDFFFELVNLVVTDICQVGFGSGSVLGRVRQFGAWMMSKLDTKSQKSQRGLGISRSCPAWPTVYRHVG